jgi:hypothetical protein
MHLLLTATYLMLCVLSAVRLYHARNLARRSLYAVLIAGWAGKALLPVYPFTDEKILQTFLMFDAMLFVAALGLLSITPRWWLRWLMLSVQLEFVVTIFILLHYFGKGTPHVVLVWLVLLNLVCAVFVAAPGWTKRIPGLRQKPLRRSDRHMHKVTRNHDSSDTSL